MESKTFRTAFAPRALILFLLCLAACTPGAGAGPSTWIDKPLDGSKLPLEPQTLMAHASDVDGVSQVEFLIGDAALGTVPVDGNRFVEARAGWSPTAPGMYLVRVRAVDRTGSVGAEAVARVQIGEVLTPTATVRTPVAPVTAPPVSAPATATVTGTFARPTAPATSTMTPYAPVAPVQATWTPTLAPVWPTRTNTPVPTRTNTPIPTRTLSPVPVCPGAPIIQSFSANPSTILAGRATTLSWGGVLNATSATVDPDIGGVATPGSVVVQPGQTTTYTLTATGCGGTVRRQVTVVVNVPPPPTAVPTFAVITAVLDRWPPTISEVTANPNPVWVQCGPRPRNSTIRAKVTDSSGVSSVILRWSGLQNGQAGMSAVGGNYYQATLPAFDRSGSLAITIQATDTRNNTGQASGPTVTVYACIE